MSRISIQFQFDGTLESVLRENIPEDVEDREHFAKAVEDEPIGVQIGIGA